MQFTLVDQAGGGKTLRGEVRLSILGQLEILVEGYSEHDASPGDGCVMLLELLEGRLRAVCFADINQSQASHIISLEGARESCRPDPREEEVA